MICVEKGKNMHSNQARLAGDFMRQKWRIYGNSYKVAWLNVLAATGIIKIPLRSRQRYVSFSYGNGITKNSQAMKKGVVKHEIVLTDLHLPRLIPFVSTPPANKHMLARCTPHNDAAY